MVKEAILNTKKCRRLPSSVYYFNVCLSRLYWTLSSCIHECVSLCLPVRNANGFGSNIFQLLIRTHNCIQAWVHDFTKVHLLQKYGSNYKTDYIMKVITIYRYMHHYAKWVSRIPHQLSDSRAPYLVNSRLTHFFDCYVLFLGNS